MYKKISIFSILLIALVLSSISLKAHPVHISVVNMDIQNDNSLSFSVKLFSDDLELIVNRLYHSDIKINKEEIAAGDYALLERYVQSHLRISDTDNRLVKYKWKQIKFTEKAVYLYFTSKGRGSLSPILKIKNTLMTDLYHDQSNLFILSDKDKKEQGYKYTKENNYFSFHLKKE